MQKGGMGYSRQRGMREIEHLEIKSFGRFNLDVFLFHEDLAELVIATSVLCYAVYFWYLKSFIILCSE